MQREEVIEKFCALATKVGTEVFKNHFAHDCFCGQNKLADTNYFAFEPCTLNFIQAAVNEKIQKIKDAKKSGSSLE